MFCKTNVTSMHNLSGSNISRYLLIGSGICPLPFYVDHLKKKERVVSDSFLIAEKKDMVLLVWSPIDSSLSAK